MHKREERHDNASELYNDYLEIYFNQYMDFSDSKKRNSGSKYDPKMHFKQPGITNSACGPFAKTKKNSKIYANRNYIYKNDLE